MKRELIRSNSFIRAAKKYIRRQMYKADEIKSTLELLSENAFDPRLKTHKLKGELENSWACSIGYDLRIIFMFVEHEGKEAILLETIGTHEEVY
ncbi:MAG: type II toxin-antitoxin system mRNA interferase toxin, RelE/StbE family [Ignavibacteriales bacterium]|nr:type II toxin-antitoxin system mRNA interferase toxin, RelE/StbE family [Ignavibacteriales bacterium]